MSSSAATRLGGSAVERSTALREACREYIALLGDERVLRRSVDLRLYSYDASLETGTPDLVVVPHSTADLAPVIAIAKRHTLPYVMRGAGTGYSGGALAVEGGVVILTRDLTAILDVDPDARLVRCEPGVILSDLQVHLADQGLRYLPDPSSHRVCTVGGTVAENAGGPHALGHGPTSNFVVAVDVMFPNGRAYTLHEDDVYCGGLDLRALLVGSEGTLGVVTGVTLRVVRLPEAQRVVKASFDRQDDAVAVVGRVLTAGLTPTALDMLTGAYLPGEGETDDPSILFIDVEGSTGEVAAQCDTIERLAAEVGGTVTMLKVDAFMQERAALVRDKVRRMVERSGLPRYYLFDCVAPRSRLPELMTALCQASERHRLPILNTFHAGDGNVHPAPFYDPAEPDHQERLRGFLADVLTRCAQLDGALSGEHGIGVEKRGLMDLFHSPGELTAMAAVKTAVDPAGLCNPGKVLPPASDQPAHGRHHRPARRSAESVRVDEANGTITVADKEITFADCAVALAGSRLELTYEPVASRPWTPVLDAVDTGLPGLREPRYPRARDLVVGCSTADGGTRRTFGGACPKDVSGYEIRKLVFGGRGRLGELSSVTLRLAARPSSRYAVEAGVPDLSRAIELTRDLLRSYLPLGCLALAVGDGRIRIVATLETFGGSLDRATADLNEVLATGGAVVSSEPEARFGWWELLPADTTTFHAGQIWEPRTAQTALSDGRTACVLPGHAAVWTAGGPRPALNAEMTELGARIAAAVGRTQ